MQPKHITAGLAVAVGLCVFSWFVWPTPWEYTRRAPDVFRIHRFSGVREVSSASGWISESDWLAANATKAAEEEALRKEKGADTAVEKLISKSGLSFELDEAIRAKGKSTPVEFRERQVRALIELGRSDEGALRSFLGMPKE